MVNLQLYQGNVENINFRSAKKARAGYFISVVKQGPIAGHRQL